MSISFAESNRIWQYEWNEPNLTSNFKLVMLPAYDGNISAPATYTLPQGIFKSIKYNYEFDKIPFGTAKNPELEIVINLDLLKADNQTDDELIFIRTLMNYAEATISGIFASRNYNFNIRLSNIFHIYFGSQLVFCGLQVDETHEGNELTIKARELGAGLLQSITENQIKNLTDYLDEKKLMLLGNNKVLDRYYYNLATKKDYSNIQKENARLWFTKLHYIDDYFIEIGKKIFEKLTRGNGNSFNIDYANYPVQFYKPDISNSGSDGGVLGYSDLYIKAKIEIDDDKNDVGTWLSEQYESVWDYYFDIARNFFARGWFTYNYDISNDIVSSCQFDINRLYPENFINITNEFALNTKYEYFNNKGIIFEPDIIDNTGIDEVNTENENMYLIRRSRTTDNYAIPFFWHNLPSIENENNFKSSNHLNIAKYNKFSLLHFDGRNFLLIFPEITFEINSTIGSQNVKYQGGFTFSQKRAMKFSELKEFYSENGGACYINPLVMAYLFNGSAVNEIEIETLLTNSVMLLANPVDYGFTFTGNTNEPYATLHSNLETNYGIKKIEAEFISTDNKYCRAKITGLSLRSFGS